MTAGPPLTAPMRAGEISEVWPTNINGSTFCGKAVTNRNPDGDVAVFLDVSHREQQFT